MALFEPLRSAEGIRYQMGIDRIRMDMFASPEEEQAKKKKPINEKLRKTVARIGKGKVPEMSGEGEKKIPAMDEKESKERPKISMGQEDNIAPEGKDATSLENENPPWKAPVQKEFHFSFSKKRGEF